MPAAGPQQGHAGREQIEEQPRIRIEAMVEISGLDHRHDVVDVNELVDVHGVPETPAQPGEPQRRGKQNESCDREAPATPDRLSHPPVIGVRTHTRGSTRTGLARSHPNRP